MGYVGKDVLHRGSGLALDPELVWRTIPSASRKNVRKAERAGFEIERVRGTAEELERLRALWYLPDDPNFPRELGPEDVCYLATLRGELAGGVILVPVGRHLFLNNLTASELGKEHQLQGYLLWHVVRDLAGSGWDYVDVGVSYRPNLQRFFEKWATFRYPVVFHPPALRPAIRFAPFARLADVERAEPDPVALARLALGRPYTILPDATWGEAVLERLGRPWRRVARPREDLDELQLVDVTRLVPAQHGALLVGEAIPPGELWSQHGCYDFVKTREVEGVLTAAAPRLDEIAARRAATWSLYADRFAREDAGALDAGDFAESFALCLDAGGERFARRLEAFGVELEERAGALHLPCHQLLSEDDVEYVYAIYRGWLNACSEWVPTHVRGVLKEAGA